MKFKVGDKIRFVDQVGEGVVSSVLPNHHVLITDEDGFDYTVHEREIMLVSNSGSESLSYERAMPSDSEIFEKNVDREKLEAEEKKFSELYKEKHASKKGNFMEVDLHIHELLENTRGMDNGEMLQHQISHFERMMKSAERKKISKVVFIHGVGEGVLKREIHNLIEQYYPNCSTQPADHREYGYGATEVRIRFN